MNCLILRSRAVSCIAAALLLSSLTIRSAYAESIDDTCMLPIDIVVQDAAQGSGGDHLSFNYLEAIEEAYGTEARNQAQTWAASGHNFLSSLYWRCIGHERAWSLDGHLRATSQRWNREGHQYGWTTDGHATELSGGWGDNGHSYQWSRDGHHTNVTRNWNDQNHAYELTRERVRPPRPGGSAGSWEQFVAPLE